MFVLHVDLRLGSDSSRAIENTYRDIFRPAISSQPGFDHVQLLQSGTDQNGYRLVIAFQDEPSQKKMGRNQAASGSLAEDGKELLIVQG